MRAVIVWLAVAACSAPPAPAHAPAHSGSAVESASDPRPIPPDLVGASMPQGKACAKDTECGAGERCFAPDFRPGRGMAPQCGGGRECGRGMVCADGSCVPRCDSTSCGAGMRCGRGGLCEPLPCTDARSTRCMQNMRCNASSGQCERVACKEGDPCDAGSCWNGYCYAHGGVCMPESYCCPP